MKKVKIGEFVQLYRSSCGILKLTKDDVSGINRDKEFFEPSKQVGADTSSYKNVPPNYFACNLMHVGRDVVLPISMNRTNKNKVVSPAYTVFKIIDETIVLNEYFFMILKSDEKDRYFWFHTDSSVRDGLEWNEFCNIELELPDIEIQRKYVNIYKGMQENLAVYQSNLEDLKLVCDGYIEDLRRNMKSEKIGRYIEEVDERNINKKVTKVQGVNSASQFCETKAKMTGIDISNYKVVKEGMFAYNPSRINIGSIALREGDDCVISPMYQVFKVVDKRLLSDYLCLWLNRSEFFRSTYFYAMGSVRDVFDMNLMKEVEIPIPDIKIQESIVKIFNAYKERKRIVDELKGEISGICPILVRGAIKEGGRV